MFFTLPHQVQVNPFIFVERNTFTTASTELYLKTSCPDHLVQAPSYSGWRDEMFWFISTFHKLSPTRTPDSVRRLLMPRADCRMVCCVKYFVESRNPISAGVPVPRIPSGCCRPPTAYIRTSV